MPPDRRRCRRRRLRTTPPARSGSCSSDLLRVETVEEPERAVRIDAHAAAAAVIHRIFERFYDEWDGDGSGAAGCRRGAADARDRAGGVRRAPRERGETGYPAMWAGRPGRADRGLRALARGRARGSDVTRALPLVRCEARFGRRDDRREDAGSRRGRADRDRARRAEAAACPGGSTASTGSQAADRDSASSTTRPARSTRREVRRAAGRADAAAAAVRARRRRAARDRPGAPATAAYVYPTRRGEFRTVEWEPEELAERHARRARPAGRDRRRRSHAATS